MTISVTIINTSNCKGDVVTLTRGQHQTVLERGESTRWGFSVEGGTVEIKGSHIDGEYLGDVHVDVKKNGGE